MKNLTKLYAICRQAHANFLLVSLKYVYYKLKGKDILCNSRAVIKHLHNLTTKGQLRIGFDAVAFMHKRDFTVFNLMGKLEIAGTVRIARGCRVAIGNEGVVRIGNGTFINPFTRVVIAHEMEVGENCAISWNCQFLDDDFHELRYEGKKTIPSHAIRIGNKVWIGANVSVYKGTTIPDGCVIAADSVVKGLFTEKNALIAGNPAKIVKSNVSW